eukprot:3801548-Ditylum_brightwellii.AAC.1
MSQEASDINNILFSKASKRKPAEQHGTCGIATLEGNQEGNRKTKGETTDNHKKLKLRMITDITDGQVKQAIDNPTHSTDKPGKGKSVSTTTGMMTEVIEPESDTIVENQRKMAPITDLVSTPGKCKPEEQSGGIGKIRS